LINYENTRRQDIHQRYESDSSRNEAIEIHYLASRSRLRKPSRLSALFTDEAGFGEELELEAGLFTPVAPPTVTDPVGVGELPEPV
jgi:hypothetical protein